MIHLLNLLFHYIKWQILYQKSQNLPDAMYNQLPIQLNHSFFIPSPVLKEISTLITNLTFSFHTSRILHMSPFVICWWNLKTAHNNCSCYSWKWWWKNFHSFRIRLRPILNLRHNVQLKFHYIIERRWMLFSKT